ncbi:MULTISPECIES: NTF2 fold immunity protein [Pseudomonas syringae group]|uniref:NTF2 fold immunity protein n=1 Tax=Pseudomonas syringae group TaxID=136849 RepID=UPI001F3425B8|nr:MULTISPECIES: NTF2 fold immunity protein [Pseudomonas syringae group]
MRKYVAEDNRNFGRLIDIGCTHPPTYDLKSDTLRVEPSEPGIIVITVQQTTGVESLSRITLNLRQGGWIIKKKETLDHKDKWRRSPL